MSGSSRHVRGRPEGDDTYLCTYEQSLTAFMFMSVPIPSPSPSLPVVVVVVVVVVVSARWSHTDTRESRYA